jgi:hypothetical protein
LGRFKSRAAKRVGTAPETANRVDSTVTEALRMFSRVMTSRIKADIETKFDRYYDSLKDENMEYLTTIYYFDHSYIYAIVTANTYVFRNMTACILLLVGLPWQ